MVFTSLAWADIPGTTGVSLYPIIRKPSIACSSTFILQTPREIIIIDPGGDSEQTQQIIHAIAPALKERPLPVFVFFTHCHVDHFLSVPLLEGEMGLQIVCHETTARALEERDHSATMADMIDIVLPTLKVGGLFFETARKERGHRRHPFPVESRRLDLASGRSLLVESFPIGEGDTMEVFHTPGHSPDGVSYRVGSVLFTGDLTLATTPGIAGLTGWDNVGLATSLEAMITIGREGNVQVVMPGHGIPLHFEKAVKVFEAVRREALGLADIAILNRARADYLSEFATVLLEEAATTFSIIAARLFRIAYYLELLEEEEHAQVILHSIDTDAIDRVLDEFYDFTAELKGTGGVPLISRAVQFVKTVEKIFEPEKVSGLLDECLLRRLKSLLGDFVNSAYGIQFGNQETVFDLNASVRELLSKLEENPHESLSIFESLDDDREFLHELTRRIAYTPLFASTRFTFSPAAEGTCTVIADRDRLQDGLSALLEQFAILGITGILLRCASDGERAVIEVLPATGEAGAVRESKLTCLRHSVRLAGGSFRKVPAEETGAQDRYILELPLAPQ
jgi:glyoxylase-like metal-dependent hydrolase (beta-lactamase superfamily II)